MLDNDKVLLYISIHPFTTLNLKAGLVKDRVVVAYREKLKQDLIDELNELFQLNLEDISFQYSATVRKLTSLAILRSKKSSYIKQLIELTDLDETELNRILSYHKEKEYPIQHNHLNRITQRIESLIPFLREECSVEEIEKLYRLVDYRRLFIFKDLFNTVQSLTNQTTLIDEQDIKQLIDQLRISND